ncbi:MAG: SsrA-binding protein SmpB [Sphaerochaetaceae bacterium]|nr:SsrA-binding protein SmpB [Sphaerochaetaceae bacterium]
MENKKTEIKTLQTNKKAYFNYEVLEDLEAGMSLEGTEVKSLRAGRFSFTDSYVKIENGEMWLIGFTIQPYDKGSIFNHEPNRNRRLLVHKQETKRLRRKVEEKGLTLVPTKVYLKGNLMKMQVSLCRGKALHDKKDAIKERDLNRQAQRDARDYRF